MSTNQQERISSTAITLRHVTKLFGDTSYLEHTRVKGVTSPEASGPVIALEDISLTIRPGEILGVLGPSGCGKSTLLRVVAGLEQPTHGEVYYNDILLQDIPIAERGIGMVFQSYALYPHLPSVDNIGFFLRLRKREQEIPERVREISRMMRIDLGPLLSRKPPTLSGGERQRVAIARCLAREPRVFLFDEPFSNLDAKLRTSARVELKRLLQKFEVTSIYVTHDQTEAIALSDRIAILNLGKLEQVGSHRHLYETPRNVFVAGFLGSPPMNLFQGRIESGVWSGQAFTWGPIRNDLPDGTELVLGIRPEHLILEAEGPLVATVDLVETLYSDRIQVIHAHLGKRPVVIRTGLDTPVIEGTVIRLGIMPDQVHLFDQVSGQRLA
jgi:ABC-type sugar transport system ATPase subunit